MQLMFDNLLHKVGGSASQKCREEKRTRQGWTLQTCFFLEVILCYIFFKHVLCISTDLLEGVWAAGPETNETKGESKGCGEREGLKTTPGKLWKRSRYVNGLAVAGDRATPGEEGAGKSDRAVQVINLYCEKLAWCLWEAKPKKKRSASELLL